MKTVLIAPLILLLATACELGMPSPASITSSAASANSADAHSSYSSSLSSTAFAGPTNFPTNLIVVGRFTDSNSSGRAAIWTKGVFADLGPAWTVSGARFSGNKLYVAGTRGSSVGVESGYWVDGVFQALPLLNVSISNFYLQEPVDLEVSSTDVYVVGRFFSNTLDHLYYWSNRTALELPIVTNVMGNANGASAIAVIGGVVWIGGYCTRDVGSYWMWEEAPCVWSNGVRIDLSERMHGGWVFDVKEVNGKPVFYGYTRNFGNGYLACTWEDGIRTDFPDSAAYAYPMWGDFKPGEKLAVALARDSNYNDYIQVSRGGSWEDLPNAFQGEPKDAALFADGFAICGDKDSQPALWVNSGYHALPYPGLWGVATALVFR